MLTGDELNKFSSPEAYLESIRSRNVNRSERPENNVRTSSVGDTVWGAVQRNEGSSPTTNSNGRSTNESIYRSDGSSNSAEGSTRSFADQLRSSGQRVARDYSGTDKYQRSTPEAARRPKWAGFGTTVNKYRDALRKDKVVESGKPGTKRPAGKTLTDAEAIKMRPKLVEYFIWQSEHLDQFIIATSGGHDDSIVIWSDLSYDEIEILVDFLIQRGKSNARTAVAVRYASVMLDRVKLGLIVLPRMYKMFMIYMTRGFSMKLTV